MHSYSYYYNTNERLWPPEFSNSSGRVAGLVVSSISGDTSHWESIMSLSDWMASENIPGIYGVDTRRLVKRIRQQESAMVGAISTSPAAVKQKVHWNQQPKQYGPAQWSCGNCEGLPGGCIRILVLDFGLKHGIVSKLLDLSNNSQIEISISPGSTTELEAEMKKKPFHGLLLSNGPGDPKNQRFAIAQLQKLFSGPSTLSEFLPILGICLGHQLISLAAGLRPEVLSWPASFSAWSYWSRVSSNSCRKMAFSSVSGVRFRACW